MVAYKRGIIIGMIVVGVAVVGYACWAYVVGYWLPRPIHKAVESGNVQEVARLLEQDPGSVNAFCRLHFTTPLLIAVKNGDRDMVALLLDKGAYPRAGTGGDAVLHIAVYTKRFDIAQLLLDKGADINVKNPLGLTPLHYAVYHATPKEVELLIKRGADVNARDNEGKTPLALAKGYDRDEVVKLLRDHGGTE